VARHLSKPIQPAIAISLYSSGNVEGLVRPALIDSSQRLRNSCKAQVVSFALEVDKTKDSKSMHLQHQPQLQAFPFTTATSCNSFMFWLQKMIDLEF